MFLYCVMSSLGYIYSYIRLIVDMHDIYHIAFSKFQNIKFSC